MKKKILILFVLAFLLFGCTIKNTSDQTASKVAGVTDTEIILGSSSALSGHAGYLGTSYLHGAMARVNQINEEGGVNGRKIKVISYDDQYDPSKCVVNTQKLINEDKVFSLFNYVGTPTAVEVIPIVEEAKIPLVGLFSGANIFRQPVKKYIFNIRASYYKEAEAAVELFVDRLNLKRIAIFYQADSYGMDGLEGAKISLQKRGLEPMAIGSYARGTLDVEDAAETILKASPEAVIMVGTYSPSAKFVRLVKEKNPSILFHSVSFVGPEEFLRDLGNYSENIIVTQVVPPPSETELLYGPELYRKGLEKYYPGEEPSFGGLEGFSNARVIIEGLRRAGKDLTRQKFVESLESLRDYSIGIGAPVAFSEDDHEGLDKIYITRISNGAFVLHNRKDDAVLLKKK